jgi:hypothetical protein
MKYRLVLREKVIHSRLYPHPAHQITPACDMISFYRPNVQSGYAGVKEEQTGKKGTIFVVQTVQILVDTLRDFRIL